MVNLKNKTVYFGYGDVVVCSNQTGFIEFRTIIPSQEIGNYLEEEIKVDYDDIIRVYENKIHDLYSLFKTVNKENRIVEYKDVTFDFSKYNEKSVQVCIEEAFNTVNIFVLAC